MVVGSLRIRVNGVTTALVGGERKTFKELQSLLPSHHGCFINSCEGFTAWSNPRLDFVQALSLASICASAISPKEVCPYFPPWPEWAETLTKFPP